MYIDVFTKNCSNYPYSSLQFTRYGNKRFKIETQFNYINNQSWFEERFGHEFESLISKALKKSYFSPNKKSPQVYLKLLNQNRLN
jgi:hypothetical protein